MDANLANGLDRVTGIAHQSEGMTLKTFGASIATGALIFAAEIAVFVLCKDRLRMIYQPRTHLVPESERAEFPPTNLFQLVAHLWKISDREIIERCGLDAFFFLRYLAMLFKIFAGLLVLLLPVLLPLNAVGGKGTHHEDDGDSGPRWNVTGLDQLAWGNIEPRHTDRYWAHFLLAIIAIVGTCIMFYVELRVYIRHRHAYLRDPRTATSTILVTAIPEEWMARAKSPEGQLHRLYDALPGGIRRIWVNRDYLDELAQKVDRRAWLAEKLEVAETAAQQKRNLPSNSAFIQFNRPVAAHMACQLVGYGRPQQLIPRLVWTPDDVIWGNLPIGWWGLSVRQVCCATAMMAILVVGAVLVAWTGFLSQLSYLAGAFPWLAWIDTLPTWFISTAQGLLPGVCLALLMALLPMLLRCLCRLQGLATGTEVELMMQQYYFGFLFVQLFLIVSVSCSFSTIYQSATEVTSWPTLLAQNVPKASNYFLSYMILQALSISAGELAQLVRLIKWLVLSPLWDSTARQKWRRTRELNEVQWGTFFPLYTTLACIGLIYCIIAPLIVVFNVLTFGLFLLVYRYNTLFVVRFRLDTGGLLFPRAINQLFTGLYVMELCLVGMFFLVCDEQGAASGQVQGGLMAGILLLTIGYQISLNRAMNPLLKYLPLSPNSSLLQAETHDAFPKAQQQYITFEHKAWRVGRVVIWFPNDALRISEDEQRRTLRESCARISVDSKGQTLDDNLRTCFDKDPPNCPVREEICRRRQVLNSDAPIAFF
ncbi:uncharacterized protein ATNIH1004_011749 [Aspergillus tanneri]|uniref:CSC1/OSCA1-like 7TM region domain-containing protein n=1 Tax=Aspergillus tanneri TaxID=1220188 RepID=A0A5M9M9L6_9EURO|nr:uncharacterized protein ATNIH1004_011749 [Aspergillus tanneri]KAA8641613.1 hypothetical protein ATNIH1004_011749 [Aspergillus tanneri]